MMAPCFGIMSSEFFSGGEHLTVANMEQALNLGLYTTGGGAGGLSNIILSLACNFSETLCNWFRAEEKFESTSVTMLSHILECTE